MSKTAETAPRAPMRRWLRVLLVGSLAVNLLVAGLVVGAVAGKFGPGRAPVGARDAALTYTLALTREDRRAIGRELRRANGAGQTSLRAARGPGYQEALSLLRATEFDAAAFEDVLARQFAASATRAETGRKALAAHVATMSAADRAAFADRLETALSHRRRYHRP